MRSDGSDRNGARVRGLGTKVPISDPLDVRWVHHSLDHNSHDDSSHL